MVWSELSGSEQLFWGGIVLMSVAVILTVVWAVAFSITGRRLKKKLEQEYGKPE